MFNFDKDIVIDLTLKPEGKRSFYVLVIETGEFIVFHEQSTENFSDVVNSVLTSNVKKICFNLNSIVSAGFNTGNFCTTYDVSLLYKNGNLYSLINSNLKDKEIKEYEKYSKKIKSAMKATVAVQAKDASLHEVTQSHFVNNFHKIRCIALMLLFKNVSDRDLDEYENYTYNLTKTFSEISNNKIRIDENLLSNIIPVTLGDRRFVKDVKKHLTDGFVKTEFNIMSSKTGRIHPGKGSFSCMTIPNSDVRNLIVSRFDSGKIVSIDFNALDYRCVMSSIDDDLKYDYSECKDFHSKTVQLLFDDESVNDIRRKIVKEATYIVMYGGSKKKLYDMGLSQKKADVLHDRISKLLAPVFDFAKSIASKARADGYIDVFDFKRLHFTAEETKNSNYVLALYAQTCSAKVFADAMLEVHNCFRGVHSKELFTVHDEFVADVHPDEDYVIGLAELAMETASEKTFDCRFTVNTNCGKSYGELNG